MTLVLVLLLGWTLLSFPAGLFIGWLIRKGQTDWIEDWPGGGL